MTWVRHARAVAAAPSPEERAYALVLAVTSGLAVFALVELSARANSANELATQTSPEVEIASDIERSTLGMIAGDEDLRADDGAAVPSST